MATLDDAGIKKRKVRKGTHSCWECRRRKIKCNFVGEDTACLPCKSRGCRCTSQEYIDDSVRVPPERRLAQRLSRLEDMMEKLVEKMIPAEATKKQFSSEPGSRSESVSEGIGPQSSSPAPSSEMGRSDGCTPMSASTSAHPSMQMPTPDSATGLARAGQQAVMNWSKAVPLPTHANVLAPIVMTVSGHPSKLETLRATILEQLPSEQDADIIFRTSPGLMFIQGLMYSEIDLREGRAETIEELTRLPRRDSHPMVLGKKLLQLSVCAQQLPPNFDSSSLQLRRPISELVGEWATMIANLICVDDELVGCSEGLEILMLQVFFQVNAGNLRKAWLMGRRALSLAQLMGIHRPGSSQLQTVDIHTDARKRPAAAYIWYRLNYIDRYLSMLLGLPCGSHDNDFGTVSETTPVERMEKRHTIISGRIIERNMARSDKAYAMTQAIDCELEETAKMMPQEWWALPSMGNDMAWERTMEQWQRLMLQLHHYSVLILLHLPYMLRDANERRWDYSKRTCLSSSRHVLIRFIRFRSLNNKALSCRHVDYSALVAAMTLILGYLGRRSGTGGAGEAQNRKKDMELVLATKAKMQDISALNGDKLSGESSQIVSQLMPIIETGSCGSDSAQDALDRSLHLNVPYLGTINIGSGACQFQTSASPHHPASGLSDQSGKSGKSGLSEPSIAPSISSGHTPAPHRPAAASLPGAPAPIPMALSQSDFSSGNPTVALGQSESVAAGDLFSGSTTAGKTSVDSVGPLNPSLYMSLDPGFSGMDPAMGVEFDDGSLEVSDDSQGQFLGEGGDSVSMPGLIADANDWLLQGVDTAYWSLLNGGFVQNN